MVSARNFDPAKRLKTHPAVLDRAFNRPRLDDMKEKMVSTAESKADVAVRTIAFRLYHGTFELACMVLKGRKEGSRAPWIACRGAAIRNTCFFLGRE